MKKCFIFIITGVVIGIVLSKVVFLDPKEKQLKKSKDLSNKHLALFILMQKWMKQVLKGKKISVYLKEKSINTVAIYGMNYAGEVLLEELKHENVNVMYALDRNADKIFMDIDVIKPTDEIPPVDAIIVTAITSFDSIEESLSKNTDSLILSLEDIVYEM